MKVYVGIPAFNAEATLKDVIKRVLKNSFVHRIIIVDDCSKDKTSAIASKFKKVLLIKHPRNRGYGGAQKTIYKKFIQIADPEDCIIMIHSDGQTLPEELNRFVKKFKNPKVDIVLGSRALGDMRKGNMPLIRIMGDRVLTWIQNFCFGMKLSTFASGFRGFRCSPLKTLDYAQHSNIHKFDTMILLEMYEKKLNMVEIPVSTIYRGEKSQYSLVRYTLGVVWFAVKYFFSIRLPGWFGSKHRWYVK